MNWVAEAASLGKATPTAVPAPHWTETPWIQPGAKVRQDRWGGTVTTANGQTTVAPPSPSRLGKDVLKNMPWYSRLGTGIGEGMEGVAAQAVQLARDFGSDATRNVSILGNLIGANTHGLSRETGNAFGRVVRDALVSPAALGYLARGANHPWRDAVGNLPVAGLAQHRAVTRPIRHDLNQTPAGAVGNLLGQIAATTAPTLAMGAGADAALGSIPGIQNMALARLVGTGATEGGTFGAMMPAFRPGDSTALNAGVMAGLGGLTPLALTGAGKLLGGGYDMVQAMIPALRDRVQAQRIAPILADLAAKAGTDFEPEAAPLQGMHLTLGQATGNPNIVALEKGTFAGGEGGAVYDRLRGINNRTLVNAIKGLGTEVDSNPSTMLQQSTRIADALSTARNAAKDQERGLWAAVDPEGLATIPKTRILQELGAANKELYAGGRENLIPADVVSRLNGLEDQVPIMRYHGIASTLAQKTADLDRSGDSVGAYALGTLSNRLRNLLYTESPTIGEGGDADGILARLNKAREFTKQRAQIFDTNPLAPLFRVDSTGAARVEPEMVGNRLMSPTHPSGLDQAREALGGNVQDLKNFYLSQLYSHGSTSQEDPWGNKMISYANLSNFLGKTRPLADRLFTEPDEQDTLDRIVKGAKLNDRVQNYVGTGGSPTAMNIESKLTKAKILGHVYSPTPWEEGIGGALIGDTLAGSEGTLPGYAAGRGIGAAQKWYERMLTPVREDILLRALSESDYGNRLINEGAQALNEPAHPYLQALFNPLNAPTKLQTTLGVLGNSGLRALGPPEQP